MEHNLFKPKNLEEAMHTVVGDCNGIPAKTRWEVETPLFAEAILIHAEDKAGFTILDYGCGCGRLAKEVIKQSKHITVVGLDASAHELEIAGKYISDSRFIPVLPHQLKQKVDLVYSVYCLQHVPAIELREVLQRIHTFLKPGGKFVYCSSDYRMAIRYDGHGFFDDQFLGVNIRREVARLFSETGDLFNPDFVAGNKVLNAMIHNADNVPGGIPHPAKVYVRRELDGNLIFNMPFGDVKDQKPALTVSERVTIGSHGPKKLILRNRLSPGDILVMTAAIRSLHKAYPGEFLTGVDTPCPDIFLNSPYVVNLQGDPEAQVIDMHYPLISDHVMRGLKHPGSGVSGRHFSDGHRKFLEEVLEIEIPRTGLVPDIFLDQNEKVWASPVMLELGYDGPYWVINAGSKGDFPLKQYHRWQEFVDLWNLRFPGIRIVQVGQLEHNHPPLVGVLDMRGKTNLRGLFRLIAKADGVFTCVSLAMHAAAALERPCVVVAGGREGTRWEMYPSHRYLHTNGAIDCCLYDGCWKSKLEECVNLTDPYHAPEQPKSSDPRKVPLCHEMIRPEDILRAAELYYLGGVIGVRQEVEVGRV